MIYVLVHQNLGIIKRSDSEDFGTVWIQCKFGEHVDLKLKKKRVVHYSLVLAHSQRP